MGCATKIVLDRSALDLSGLTHQDSPQLCQISSSFEGEFDLLTYLLGNPEMLKLPAFYDVEEVFLSQLVDEIFLA